MKAFVTGGTGFVGSHLVDALLERGDQVVCLVRDLAKTRRVFHDRFPNTVVGSLDNVASLREGCENADVIFHVAGLITAKSRDEFFAVNAEATARLVDVATHATPDLRRFVYVSSQAAAGPSTRGSQRTEQDPPAPVSDYGRSKLAGEEAVRTSPFSWTIVRPPAVYGPRDTEFLRVFKLARSPIVPLVSDPGQELSLIYVADLVEALLASTSDAARNNVYFASHADFVTAGQLIHHARRAVKPTDNSSSAPILIRVPEVVGRAILTVTGEVAKLFGKATILTRDKANELMAAAWVCSSAALERDTGWKAKTSHEAGFRETARWYREKGWL